MSRFEQEGKDGKDKFLCKKLELLWLKKKKKNKMSKKGRKKAVGKMRGAVYE